MKRSSLKRRATKYPTAAQLQERREWAAGFTVCWICGDWKELQVHEIGSRARAPGKWCDVRNLFRACASCNTHVLNNLPECLQLAWKKHWDEANYDRVFVNRIRGRADDAISESEVRAQMDFVRAVCK